MTIVGVYVKPARQKHAHVHEESHCHYTYMYYGSTHPTCNNTTMYGKG